jgi:hypothetical protein
MYLEFLDLSTILVYYVQIIYHITDGFCFSFFQNQFKYYLKSKMILQLTLRRRKWQDRRA